MTLTAVVTGATGGIGKQITRGLLRQGAKVIIGVRNLDKAEALRAELTKDKTNGTIEILPLDVSNLKSVREFADTVTKNHPALQLLINNAGAWFNERAETPEGNELTLATNVIGPYLLTNLLLKPLTNGSPSRIINIVSSAMGSYDSKDLEWNKRKYSAFKAYTQSKQALSMLTWRLSQRLEATGVVANTVSPGVVKTDFLQNSTGFMASLLRLSLIIAVTPEKGAETPLWVALAPELSKVSGKYFENHKQKPSKFREQAALIELEAIINSMTGINVHN